MKAIAAQYRKKSQLDDKVAWIGRAFSALRTRMLNYGGGEIVTVVELLRNELSDSCNETVAEMLDWMSHFEAQQRGMYSRIIELTDLLSKEPDLQAIPNSEQIYIFRNIVAGLPESERINVADFKPSAIYGDLDILHAVLQELLLNSIKFSPAGSNVDVCFSLRNGSLIVQIVNCCHARSTVLQAIERPTSSGLGEPFIGGYDHPRFQLMGHDLCIGLSFAQSLIHKVGGSLNIATVQDYSNGERRPRFAATVTVPLASAADEALLQRARHNLKKIASAREIKPWTQMDS